MNGMYLCELGGSSIGGLHGRTMKKKGLCGLEKGHGQLLPEEDQELVYSITQQSKY